MRAQAPAAVFFAVAGLAPLVVSLPLSLAVGWASYRVVMRPIIHASHNVQIFTTVGLSIALQNLALVLWTGDARFVRTGYYAVVVRLGGAAFNVAQIAAFVLAVGLTAVCGALWAQYVGFVDPVYVFSVDISVRFALAAIIGGLGTALGPFLGSVLVTTVETYLRAQFGGIGAGFVGIYLILYGCALIVMVRFAPHGLVGWLGARLRRRAVAQAPS